MRKMFASRRVQWVWTLIALTLWTTYVNAQSCSATQLCTSGCCSKYGNCGFGPAFCGAGNCTSTCNAVAQCGQYAPANQRNCPLGVCCSQYGFCGTTSEFCGTGCQNGCAKVTEPSCGGHSSNRRNIGYYESWASTRTCDAWMPEDLSPALWTHLNYAFALIDSSNRISQMNSFDTDFYGRIVNLKSANPALQVFISVGGWAQGAAAWSQMASTPATRNTFIQSAIQLMTTYGFDGMDLDWEYPAAADRGGVPADTANFVSLLKEFRAASGSRFQVTATLPSSYWYLQGFDIVNMMTYLDWVNFMSYDIHGTWDGSSQWTSAIVQPHTNLTEISQGLDLLWRNNIDPTRVVLGLAFYGRSFTLASPSCSAVGCPFSGGGAPGSCTGTAGILSDAEIQRIIAANSITPTLDKTAGVKYMNWNTDQWVSYDDFDTFIIKKQFANKLCLGGVMVWAVDLDDPTTLNSGLALWSAQSAAVSTPLNPAGLKAVANAKAATQAAYLSGYWTTCSSNAQCVAGYYPVTWASGRIMEADIDIVEDNGETCGYGGAQRALCLSENVQLTGCSWFGTPKTCNTLCPQGYLMLALNSQPNNERIECEAGGYAVYCCQSVWASPLQFCGSNAFGYIRNAVIGAGSVGTINQNSIRGTGYGGWGYGGIGVDDPCFDPYYNTLNTNQYDANIDMGENFGYFDDQGNLRQNGIPNPGGPGTPMATITTTYTASTTVYSTKTVTCNGASYPQACQHYRSVIYNAPAALSLGVLTCATASGVGRPEVTNWNRQHTNVWITSWVAPVTKLNGGSDTCQRDEYPPFHFYQGAPGAYIRLLPGSQNGGAGQQWRGVCTYPPLSSTRVWPLGAIYYNGYYLDQYSKTITSTLGVMDYNFDAGTPNYPDDGISANPCVPWTLTDDAGFALVTDDPWYLKNGRAESATLAAYRVPPSPALIAGRRDWFPYWAMIGDDPWAPPAGNTKRWIMGEDGEALHPNEILVDEGNSTRRATEEELWETFQILKCQEEDCAEEFEALGLEPLLAKHQKEEIAVSEQVMTEAVQPVLHAQATPKPASGRSSWEESIPIETKQSSEDLMTTSAHPPVPTGKRHIRHSRQHHH